MRCHSIRLWHAELKRRFQSAHPGGSHHAVIGLYDVAGNIMESHGPAGEFKEW
jgi:hypothetical protein